MNYLYFKGDNPPPWVKRSECQLKYDGDKWVQLYVDNLPFLPESEYRTPIKK